MSVTEVLNALLITYIATEYNISSSSSPTTSSTSSSSNKNSDGRNDHDHNEDRSYSSSSIKTFLSARHNQIVLIIVLVVNLLDKFVLAQSEIALFVRQFLERLLHAPKIALVILLYILVLYVDCARHLKIVTTKASSTKISLTTDNANANSNSNGNKTIRQILPIRRFLKCVGIKFLTILPVYPLLAVFISFFFMVVISLLEHLHLPLQWLNWPIYYGTLYGPFSLVYFQVKETIINERRYFIPTTTATTRGSASAGIGAGLSRGRRTGFGISSRRYGRNISDDRSIRSLRLAYFDNDDARPNSYYCSNEDILSYTDEYVSFHNDLDNGSNDGGSENDFTQSLDCPV